MNNPRIEHLTAHERDREMIKIILDEEETSLMVGYSQNYGGAKRDWSDVNKVDGSHPKVYLSKNGNASYFYSGNTWLDEHEGKYLENNSVDPDTPVPDDNKCSIQLINSQNWLDFKGDWGKDSGSVSSPTYRHTKPNGPTDWISDWYTTESHMWIEPMYWQSVTTDRG